MGDRAAPVTVLRPTVGQGSARQLQPFAIPAQRHGVAKVGAERALRRQLQLRGAQRIGGGVIGVALPASPLAAQLLQLARRALVEAAMLQRQLARAGHGVDPAVTARRVGFFILLGYAHPAEQQAAAIFHLRRLGRVELEAGVQLAKFAVAEGRLPVIQLTEQIAGLITVEIAFRLRRQPLRAADQHVVAVQREQVRALPHVAEFTQVVQAGTGDLPQRLPVAQIAGTQQQHLAAILQVTRAEHHVPGILMTPHFRIAYVAAVALRQRQHRPEFAVFAPIAFLSQALVSGARAVGEFHVAGVDQRDFVFRHHRRAGVTAVAVVTGARRQGDRLMFPTQ